MPGTGILCPCGRKYSSGFGIQAAGSGEQITSSPVSVDPARPHPAPEEPTTTVFQVLQEKHHPPYSWHGVGVHLEACVPFGLLGSGGILSVIISLLLLFPLSNSFCDLFKIFPLGVVLRLVPKAQTH